MEPVLGMLAMYQTKAQPPYPCLLFLLMSASVLNPAPVGASVAGGILRPTSASFSVRLATSVVGRTVLPLQGKQACNS